MGRRSLQVLLLFFRGAGRQYSGAEITRELGIKSGSLYPILARFEEDGILESFWEQVDPSQAGRPRQRFYEITAFGARVAEKELSDFFGPNLARPINQSAGFA